MNATQATNENLSARQIAARKAAETRRLNALKAKENSVSEAHAETPTPETEPTIHFTDSLVSNVPFARLLAKRDITSTQNDSEFTAISIAVNRKESAIWIERDNHVMYSDQTQANDAVLVRVSTLRYGRNSAQAASLIAGVRRWFQDESTFYVSAKTVNDDSGKRIVVIDSQARKSLKDDSDMITLSEDNQKAIARRIFQYVKILEDAKRKPRDQREESVTKEGKEVFTPYGMYRRQQRSE